MNIGNYNPVARYLGSTSVSALMLGAGSVWTNAPALTAPTLTWTSAETDATPEFTVTFVSTPEVGDTVEFQIDDDPAFGSTSDTSDTVDAGEVTANDVVLTLAALADGTYSARARHVRGATVSDWSDPVTVTISTAPAVTFDLAYVSTATFTNTSPTTLAAMGLGAPDANRVIAVGITGRHTGAVGTTSAMTAVSIAGVAATKASGAAAGAGQYISEIWYASVPAGTTGDIVLTHPTVGFDRGAIVVYRVVTSTPTPAAGAQSAATATTARTQSISVPAGGGAMAFAGNRGSSSFTWTNATEDVDATIAGTNSYASAEVNGTGVVSVTVTATQSNDTCLSLVAWGP